MSWITNGGLSFAQEASGLVWFLPDFCCCCCLKKLPVWFLDDRLHSSSLPILLGSWTKTNRSKQQLDRHQIRLEAILRAQNGRPGAGNAHTDYGIWRQIGWRLFRSPQLSIHGSTLDTLFHHSNDQTIWIRGHQMLGKYSSTWLIHLYRSQH